ncbi:FosX/FosE/FosI family fosfomycin resistance hydrolase [Breznakia pachnodae]|uniref:Catechol 2,3-dioxygenase-like lactoylglutathione lyase family enzyme n=1 Tax=Breznakia pachnodae TaxID=265178 RepID=A0ABU0E3I8_9FIRM|nr:FosX/FosE/FosI family fosfomycin resistance hydrolase [Breznakia pachnodae]MDQ0361253.1 catechol 2,3-dioxygenase-like lactoylglutathione lyase family enzyme [Breznakia pachnodae]
MIKGISHITFIVKDLDKMKLFLETIFDAKEVYSSDGKEYSLSKEKFFLIGDIWIATMEGDSLKEKTYNHIAFRVDDNEFSDYADRIRQLGVEIKPERSRVEGEGQSIYFYDYDKHLFEIHSGTLTQRLQRYNQ